MKTQRGWSPRHTTTLALLAVLTGGALAASLAGAGGAERTHGSPKIVFDQGHGQRFVIDQRGPLDLSTFADVFRDRGFTVEVSPGPFSEQVLATADAVMISGPFAPFQPAEIEAVAAFVERGGRLCVTLHIAPPAAALLGRLGVVTSNGVVHEASNLIDGKDLEFSVSRIQPHPVMSGVTQFNVYGSWALLNGTADAEVVARTTPRAWVDLNGDGTLNEPQETRQSLGIVVGGQLGRGAFVAFGDDAVFQNQFLRDGNLGLAKNLARWMHPSPPSL